MNLNGSVREVESWHDFTTTYTTVFWNETLHSVWLRMGAMPPGMVLIGGTAVAMYFNHRASTDLDWMDTTRNISESVIFGLTAFDDVGEIDAVNGGLGAVDCVLRTRFAGHRNIDMNFIEPEERFAPELSQAPVPAVDNGALIAHPIDLARMKTMALFSRGALRDYLDVGIFAEREPAILIQAVDLIRKSKTINERNLLMALTSPPDKILDDIPDVTQDALTKFSNRAFKFISEEKPKSRTRD